MDVSARIEPSIFTNASSDLVLWQASQELAAPGMEEELLTNIGLALETGRTFTVEVKEDGVLGFHDHQGWGEWLWSWVSASVSRERQRQVAEFLLTVVRERQSYSIESNSDDYGLELVKRFLRKLGPGSDLEELKLLERELIAARLGIGIEVLDANEGFEAFAKEAHLHRYLLKFTHHIWIDHKSNEIYLRKGGTMTPWSEIREGIVFNELGLWQGYYARDGIRQETIFDWTVFKPYTWEDPAAWGDQYLFEIIVWTAEARPLDNRPSRIADAPQITNTHTCVRLRTPEQDKEKGNTYSVGLTRPRKFSAADHFKAPLGLRKGDLMSPDETEFWGGRTTTISKMITPQQFRAIVEEVERDKRQGLPYQVTHQNCNEYALKLAELAGMENMQSYLPASQLFLPRTVSIWADHTISYLPRPLQALATGTAALGINTMTLFFGSGSVERGLVNQMGVRIAPLISAHFPRLSATQEVWRVDLLVRNLLLDTATLLLDLVDDHNAQISHPWVLGEPIRQQIEEWRHDELHQLHERLQFFRFLVNGDNSDLNEHDRIRMLAQIEDWEQKLGQNVQYSVPPRFLTNYTTNDEAGK